MGVNLTKSPPAKSEQRRARHDRACNCVECRLERLEYGRDDPMVSLVHDLVRGFALLLPTIAKMPQFKELAYELREFQERIESVCREIDEDGTKYNFTG